MLQALITSKTRIKLLMKFFLNSRNTSYLRNLAAEYGESTNAIRVEIVGWAAGSRDARPCVSTTCAAVSPVVLTAR
jgi:hypothetical protein